MKDQSGDDRRGAQRYSMQLPVEVQSPAAGGRLITRTDDVSFRGVYFHINQNFEVNSTIDLVLTLPHEVTLSEDVRVHCVGRVVRVEHPGTESGGQVGVAAVIERYDFLPSPAKSA
ncbi:MAG: PilZ domain-containing protein [Candidatus Acidiferrales bacterium]